MTFPTRSEFTDQSGNVKCNLCYAFGGRVWGDRHAEQEHFECPECGQFFTHLGAHRSRKHRSLACYGCGLEYGGAGWCDVVVADDVWKAISPTGNESGILCFNCMAARLAALGMTDVEMRVKSGPFVHDVEKKPQSHSRDPQMVAGESL